MSSTDSDLQYVNKDQFLTLKSDFTVVCQLGIRRYSFEFKIQLSIACEKYIERTGEISRSFIIKYFLRKIILK